MGLTQTRKHGMVDAVIKPYPETREEQEERLLKLHEAAEAGCFDDVFVEQVNYLIGQLPEGYTLDEEARVVRSNPNMPDQVYVTSRVNGVPSGRVKIPVYTGEPSLPDQRAADLDPDRKSRRVAGGVRLT